MHALRPFAQVELLSTLCLLAGHSHMTRLVSALADTEGLLHYPFTACLPAPYFSYHTP